MNFLKKNSLQERKSNDIIKPLLQRKKMTNQTEIKQGVLKQTFKSESVEVLPFASVADEKQFLNVDDFVFARIITDIEHIHTMNGENILHEKERNNGEWSLVQKAAVDNYMKNGESFEQGRKKLNAMYAEESNLFYVPISRKVLDEIKEVGLFDTVGRKIGVNIRIAIGEITEATEKYVLCKFFSTQTNLSILEYEKDKYFTSGLYLDSHTINSDNWELEELLEKVIDNEQVKFLISKNAYGGGDFIIADKNNQEHLSRVITEVPSYNQNNAGDLEEVNLLYLPNDTEVKSVFKNGTSEYNERFNWVKDFLPDEVNEEMFNKLHYYESEKLIPTCMKGIQASKVFHASKVVNTKEEEPPKSRFRK